MANNITPSSCRIGETAEQIKDNISVAAYEVFLPFYFLIGICGHGICLFAFSKQYRKKEKAYGYQILVSFGDLMECIFVSFGRLTAGNLSGLRMEPGSNWFQENYAMMWFTAHITIPLEQTVLTMSLLLYVTMAADRAFAVASPLKHKTFDHTRHQILAAIISSVLGVSTSISDGFEYQVRQTAGQKYELDVDEEFVDSTLAFASDIFRNVLRIIGTVPLITCNIVMVVSYHIVECRRIKRIEGLDERVANRKRRATQKTLLLLTLFQSLFQTLDMTLYNVDFTLVYSIPGFAGCYGLVLAPICDLVQEIAGTVELFALLTICKPLRRTIFATLPRSVKRIFVG